MKLKRVIIISMMLSISIVLNILEGFIPMFIPGVKLGLANIIVLIMLYEFNASEAFLVMLLRVVLAGILRGNFMQPPFIMSLCGGLFSFVAMLVFSKLKIFSIIGVSIMGSIMHSFGQILSAILLLSTLEIIYYLPLVVLLSTLTGLFTGFVGKRYLKINLLKKIDI